MTSLASTNGPSVTRSLPPSIATCAPCCNGAKPPMSTIRPALISRSVSLPIASIMAGVGPFIGCEEITMDMKRMKNSCGWRVAGVRPAIPSRYRERRSGGGRIDMLARKYFGYRLRRASHIAVPALEGLAHHRRRNLVGDLDVPHFAFALRGEVGEQLW